MQVGYIRSFRLNTELAEERGLGASLPQAITFIELLSDFQTELIVLKVVELTSENATPSPFTLVVLSATEGSREITDLLQDKMLWKED